MGNSSYTKKKQPQISSKRVLDELEEASKEYEEDEVEEQQIPNKNDVVEQNLHIDVDAKAGEIKERINLNIQPRQETIQLKSTTQILPVIV